MQNIIRTFTAAILAFAAVSCAKSDANAVYPGVGSRLPSFTVTMKGETSVSSADLSSGLSLIVFFHTMCEDCQKELEILQPFHDDHRNEFPIILISRAEGDDEIAEYWERHDFTMPYSPQEDRSVYDLFSDSGIPHVVLSRDGIIIGIWNDKDIFNEKEFRRCLTENL